MESHKHSLFKGILLLSDIDGTLLNSDKTIPERNVKAVQHFIKQGGLFSLATGRCAQSAKPYAIESGVNAPSVVLNGALIYDYQKDMTAYQKMLPSGFQYLLKEVHTKFPHIGIEVYIGSDIVIPVSNEIIDRQLSLESLIGIPGNLSSIPAQANKILFGASHEQLTLLQSFLDTCSLDGMYGMFTETCYYEILSTNTTKGSGAKTIADLCGVDYQNVVAVGDYYNDIDMLKSVAHPVAAGNAPEEVQNLAHFVTGDCNCGVVADTIEYIEKQMVEHGHL